MTQALHLGADKHLAEPLSLNDHLDAFGHTTCHGAAVSARDLQVRMRTRNIEPLEEDIRHIGAEVLAGVNDDFFNVVTRLDGATDGRDLYELRSGAEFHVSNALAILS